MGAKYTANQAPESVIQKLYKPRDTKEIEQIGSILLPKFK